MLSQEEIVGVDSSSGFGDLRRGSVRSRRAKRATCVFSLISCGRRKELQPQEIEEKASQDYSEAMSDREYLICSMEQGLTLDEYGIQKGWLRTNR